MTEIVSTPKTTKQLLIEERSGKDIREVLIEAYRASDGSIMRAADWITERYGEPVSFGIFSDWVEKLGGRKALEFPSLAEPPADLAGAAK